MTTQIAVIRSSMVVPTVAIISLLSAGLLMAGVADHGHDNRFSSRR
jgi:hypothetical protein